MDARRFFEPGGTASSAGNHLDGVACPSTANGWADGVFHITARRHHWPDQIMHWNGTRWSAV